MAPPRNSGRSEVDGPHGPDGFTGEFCAYCSRKASLPTSHTTVRWPCPAVRKLRGEGEK